MAWPFRPAGPRQPQRPPSITMPELWAMAGPRDGKLRLCFAGTYMAAGIAGCAGVIHFARTMEVQGLGVFASFALLIWWDTIKQDLSRRGGTVARNIEGMLFGLTLAAIGTATAYAIAKQSLAATGVSVLLILLTFSPVIRRALQRGDWRISRPLHQAVRHQPPKAPIAASPER